MNVYPIGNNLTVKWTLRYSDGTVFPLSLYDYEFSYRTSRGVKVATDTTVEDNVLSWMLKADDQVVSGPYSLALKISFAGNKVVDLQYNNVFALTSLSHGNGANVEVCIESNCDMIDLKDAVLQARKAMDVAQTAKDIAGSAVNTAGGAVATANEAKTIASTANNTSTEAKTIANNAKTVAEKAATDASRDAFAAQQAAQTASDHITSLQQAIAELPDGQAVTEKVAEHTTELSELKSKSNALATDAISIDSDYNFVASIIKNKGINEDGVINDNNTRSIVILKCGEHSNNLTIVSDGIIKAWYYYSSYPDYVTGANHIPPRVVTSDATRGIRTGAKYVALMLDTSNGFPTYMYCKQEGNFISRKEVLSTIFNVSLEYPTGGIDGTDVYTQTGARQAVPNAFRKNGTIIIYKYADTIRMEQFIGNVDDTEWLYGTWVLFNSKSYINLNEYVSTPFETRQIAREKVAIPLRKKGLIISYTLASGKTYTERYIGDVWTTGDSAFEDFAMESEIADIKFEKNLTLLDTSVYIESGAFRVFVPFSSIFPKTEKCKVRIGIDCTLILHDSNSRNLAKYVINKNEDTEIVIPQNTNQFIVDTIGQVPVTTRTTFDIKAIYDTEFDRLDKYQEWLEYRKLSAILRNLNRTDIGDGNVPDKTYAPLVLAGLTDIHNDNFTARKYVETCLKFKAYINEMIGLGDYVNGAINDSEYNLDAISGFGNMLKAIGNHDAYNTWPYTAIVDDATTYNKWIAPNVSKWGVNYQQGKCFYYKDYDSSHIRLIVLDYMHWDESNDANGQKAWFNNVLINNADSALNKGYHAVVVCHAPIMTQTTGKFVQFDRCPFTQKDKEYTTGFNNNTIAEIVDSFQNLGGNFICYLFGHLHRDMVGTYENYPNQIFIAQSCTSGMTDGNDTDWSTDAPWALRFNLYSFDYKKKFIRVYQVGESIDRNMQQKKGMLITYDTNVEGKLLNA